MTLTELQRELYIANEGLAQMQEPDAGYKDEPEKLKRDVDSQCEQIAKLERQIARLKGEM